MTTKKTSRKATAAKRAQVKSLFTQQEATFLLNVLSNLQVNPAAEDAAGAVQTVQSIIQKVRPMAPQAPTE